MAEESFLLVSLKEDKAKKLAQVISNDTSRKILDYLSKNDTATESDICEKLKIPLSTVHYNMQHLVEAKLVNSDEFTYSKKGKEMIHYSLSNKFVIIAPKSTESLKEKLKKILPVFLAIGAVSFVINSFNRFGLSANKLLVPLRSADVFVDSASDIVAERAVLKTAEAPLAQAVTSEPNISLWFFAGAVFGLVVLFVWNFILSKRQ